MKRARLFGLAALLTACGHTAPPAPRLVVLYATCTLSKAHLGPYAGVSYTPNLDAFAAESLVFERHQSESGQSGISFASIFSGAQSDVHGIYDHPNELPDSLYLVTEAFRDAGYDTYFFTGHLMACADLNYAQGVEPEHVFDATKGARKKARVWSFLQPANPLVQELVGKLRADPEYRAFVLANFTVTHGRYHKQIPEAEYAQFLARHPDATRGLSLSDLEEAWAFYDEHRFDLQWGYDETVRRLGLDGERLQRFRDAIEVTYAADVAYLDAMFGGTLELLRSNGLLEDSLIAFTADHGETFDREGTEFKWTHGLQLAPEVLEVPWIVRAPELGVAPGRYSALTRSIDVFPTLYGLAGRPGRLDLRARGVVGEDLSAAVRAEESPPELVAYSHTTKIGAHMVEDFSRWTSTRRYFSSDSVDRIWVRLREGDRVYKWRICRTRSF